jgi:CHRD domain
MRKCVVVAFALLLSTGSMKRTVADDDEHKGGPLRANLIGLQEVPAISTTGKGTFEARVNDSGTAMDFKLQWENLQGASVTQAHIHFGQPAVNGGIIIWLCGSATNPGPAGTPVCPGPLDGTVEGTIDASKVVGPATPPGQGILATEFAEALKAIRAGMAYANVHTNTWPGGEIRGQIRGRHGVRSLLVPPGKSADHDHGSEGRGTKD